MKKAYRCLLLIVFMSSFSMANAQTFGKESLVLEKNIFIGFKGGVTALDMQYYNGQGGFVNHSTLYQGSIKDCMVGSIFVERSIPGFSYGLEFVVNNMNAVKPSDEVHYASQDSAFFASIRIPVKVKFLENKLFSPYLFIAPSIGTYLSEETGLPLNGHSIWNGTDIQWGTNNTSSINLNLIGGAGVEGKIEIGLYEIRARFEASYNLGLMSMTPSEAGFDRKMRGWEATIGLAFPLFINPSYVWFN